MNSLMESNYCVAEPEYGQNFWKAMQGQIVLLDKLNGGRHIGTGTFRLPVKSADRIIKAIADESVFRQIGTCIRAHGTGNRIFAVDSNDMAMFVPERGEIPIYEGADDFRKMPVDSWKLAAFIKCEADFIHDATFDIEKCLDKRFGKAFARAETDAFINGTGEEMPTGILNDVGGAEIAFTTESITYDDLISLYFSVEAEYRSKGTWLMNDETAMTLRKLKDENGNYLWNPNSDTILGKPVVISEFMPCAGSGKKPVAFGDFSYYWVIDRRPVTMRPIVERFAINDQIGYIAYEFLDGKLVRQQAIKVLRVK